MHTTIYISTFLHFNSKMGTSIHRDYSDCRPPPSRQTIVMAMGFYVPFGEIVAHTDEGLPRAEGFNCDRRTGDFLRSLDPHVDAVLRRRGSFHRVHRKSLFFFLFRRSSSSSRALIILCTSKATRPDASRTRQCNLVSFSFFLISCTRPLFIRTFLLFHLFFHFWREGIRTFRKYVFNMHFSWSERIYCNIFGTNIRKNLTQKSMLTKRIIFSLFCFEKIRYNSFDMIWKNSHRKL